MIGIRATEEDFWMTG